MEYITNIEEPLKSIDESNIKYLNMMDYPEFFFGNINFVNKKVDFCKYSKLIQDEMTNFGNVPKKEMENLNAASCGNRIRFHTTSSRVILKVKLRKKWDYQKLILWNSSGFDIYDIIGDEYVPRTIIAPMEGENFFAEMIYVPINGQICIFLPNYNTIEDIYIGIEENSTICPLYYSDEKQIPILFYGNSITQGAAASKSGNSFPNLVSKFLNQDIINLSCSSCCRGTDNIADQIGRINCDSIIIDYTRNAESVIEFKNTYEKFYKKIRLYHPNKKIILMTSASFNHLEKYDEYDEIINKTFLDAKSRNENTFFINQKLLFNKDEWDYVVIDSAHYTDYGMYKIANEICKILTQ